MSTHNAISRKKIEIMTELNLIKRGSSKESNNMLSSPKRLRSKAIKTESDSTKKSNYHTATKSVDRVSAFIQKRSNMLSSIRRMNDNIQIQLASNTVHNLNNQIRKYLNEAETDFNTADTHTTRHKVKSTDINAIIAEDLFEEMPIEQNESTRQRRKFEGMKKLYDANEEYEVEQQKVKYNILVKKEVDPAIFLRFPSKGLYKPSTQLESQMEVKSYKPQGFTSESSRNNYSHIKSNYTFSKSSSVLLKNKGKHLRKFDLNVICRKEKLNKNNFIEKNVLKIEENVFEATEHTKEIKVLI